MFKNSESNRTVETSNRSARRAWRNVAIAFGIASLPVLASAAPVDIPNAFAEGDIISADDFNDNFDAIGVSVDDNDARISDLEAGATPTGSVIFFDGTECPEGWSELEAARGRAVVGLNGSAGTLLGEVGTGLADLGTPSHGHGLSGAGSVTTTSSSVPHTHLSGSYGTNSTGTHNHQWLSNGNSSYTSGGASFPMSLSNAGIGAIVTRLTSNRYTNNDGSHSHDVTGTSANASGTSHSHSVSLGGLGVTAANGSLPYLQLLVCRRD
ncbi:MAG: hypothetical protein JKY37_22580 [Nannocystaceae bacterium]|nr:hypothetical protein [Nannocystaceae bacterium]